MDVELWVAVAGTAAAVVATGVTAWVAVSAVGRPARLRRDEALWQGILDAGTAPGGHQRLVRDLHRHTAAQLIAIRLTPPRNPVFTKFMLLLGVVLGLLLGVLFAAIGIEGPRALISGPGDYLGTLWLIVGSLFLLVAVCLHGALGELADNANTRNAVTRDLLKDEPLSEHDARGGPELLRRQYRKPRGVLGFNVIMLGVGGTLFLAGLSGLLLSLGTVLVASGTSRHLWVAGGALMIYLMGSALMGVALGKLVDPLPCLPSSAGDASPPETSLAPDNAGGLDAAPTGPTLPSPGGRTSPLPPAAAGLLAGWILGRRVRGRDLW